MSNESYLLKVRETLISSHDPNRVLTAAWAGKLVREQVGPCEKHGYTKFKEVLEELQTRGDLSLTFTEQGALAILFRESGAELPNLLEKNKNVAKKTSLSSRLAPEIWCAFVHIYPLGDRYLNTKTGIVLSEQNKSPDGKAWKKIEIFSFEADLGLAKSFLKDRNLKIEIDQDEWPQKFISSLLVHNRSLLKKWNQIRSEAVVCHVKKWAQKNDVASDILFLSGERSGKKKLTRENMSLARRREIILKAIQRMNNAELFDIEIKAKHLLDVISG